MSRLGVGSSMVMKKVYTADSPAAIAWHFRNVLEQHGIASLVKNDLLYSVGGEVPIHECFCQRFGCKKG